MFGGWGDGMEGGRGDGMEGGSWDGRGGGLAMWCDIECVFMETQRHQDFISVYDNV